MSITPEIFNNFLIKILNFEYSGLDPARYFCRIILVLRCF